MAMFGSMKRATKAALAGIVDQAEGELKKSAAEMARLRAQLGATQERVDFLESQHRELVNEKVWWQDQALQYSNQVSFWQDKNREILGQLAKEKGHVDLRKYIGEVQEQILLAAPKAAEVAAVIALSRSDTQGVLPKGFDPHKPHQLLDAPIEIIDVEDGQ